MTFSEKKGSTFAAKRPAMRVANWRARSTPLNPICVISTSPLLRRLIYNLAVDDHVLDFGVVNGCYWDFEWIAVHHDQVRKQPRLDGSHAVAVAELFRCVHRV